MALVLLLYLVITPIYAQYETIYSFGCDQTAQDASWTVFGNVGFADSQCPSYGNICWDITGANRATKTLSTVGYESISIIIGT